MGWAHVHGACLLEGWILQLQLSIASIYTYKNQQFIYLSHTQVLNSTFFSKHVPRSPLKAVAVLLIFILIHSMHLWWRIALPNWTVDIHCIYVENKTHVCLVLIQELLWWWLHKPQWNRSVCHALSVCHKESICMQILLSEIYMCRTLCCCVHWLLVTTRCCQIVYLANRQIEWIESSKCWCALLGIYHFGMCGKGAFFDTSTFINTCTCMSHKSTYLMHIRCHEEWICLQGAKYMYMYSPHVLSLLSLCNE